MGVDRYYEREPNYPWRTTLERLLKQIDWLDHIDSDHGELVWCIACDAEYLHKWELNAAQKIQHAADCPYVAARELLKKYYDSLSPTAEKPKWLYDK